MLFKISSKYSHRKTDEELVAEFKSSGNPEVLGELYSGYMHLVYGVCLKYLKDRDESKDAVMQIFEKLITDIPRHEIESFRGWLYVLSRNYCLMQLRLRKSQEHKLSEWAVDNAEFMETATIRHPIDEDGADMEAELADCIKRLKNEQKECINLFYFENKCYKEISASLNLDEKKVKSHLQNAKRNLKLCLEEKHGLHE